MLSVVTYGSNIAGSHESVRVEEVVLITTESHDTR